MIEYWWNHEDVPVGIEVVKIEVCTIADVHPRWQLVFSASGCSLRWRKSSAKKSNYFWVRADDYKRQSPRKVKQLRYEN